MIRYLFPERSVGKVPVALAVATTMHLPFKESMFPENSVIWGLLFYTRKIHAKGHPHGCLLLCIFRRP